MLIGQTRNVLFAASWLAVWAAAGAAAASDPDLPAPQAEIAEDVALAWADGQDYELAERLDLMPSIRGIPLNLPVYLLPEDAPPSATGSPNAVSAYYAGVPGVDGIRFDAQDEWSNIRSVSLLTLMRTERSRLFLGVSERGLPGLHFNTTGGSADDTQLELWRLPDFDSDDSWEPDERP